MRATVSTVTDAKDKAGQLCWSHQRLAAVSILWFLPTRTHPRTRDRIQVWSAFFSFCSWSLEVFTMNNTRTSSQHHTSSMDETWLLKEFIWNFCHYLLSHVFLNSSDFLSSTESKMESLEEYSDCHFPYDKIIQLLESPKWQKHTQVTIKVVYITNRNVSWAAVQHITMIFWHWRLELCIKGIQLYFKINYSSKQLF